MVQTVGSVAAALHWLASPRRPRPPVPIGSTAPKSSELAVARPCGTCEGQTGGGSERDCGGVRGPVLGLYLPDMLGCSTPDGGGGVKGWGHHMQSEAVGFTPPNNKDAELKSAS